MMEVSPGSWILFSIGEIQITSITGMGAENVYYLSLPQPYHAKNAPFDTMDELLWVKGIDPETFYGDTTGARKAWTHGTRRRAHRLP